MSITADERLKWWHEARFGMFIHWGVYAVPAGEWKGEKISGIGEWIMRGAKIPIDEYEKLADDFNPVKFDADEWAEVAKQAGMKYLVITSKHHDGFCMFDSPSNPYNIVNKTPFKRDPLKELADACNKRGIRMCFYYSQAQDWHAPGGAGHWEEEGEGGWQSYTRPAEDFQKYLDDIVKPDLRQLLTNYGPIGLIWFDTPVFISQEQSEGLRDFVHELQPECLVSGRVGHGVGDYGSLGDNQHPAGKVEGAWETPATLNDTWGFKSDDHNWKSLEFLIELLVNCASKGVNYLLNVGPTAEGVIPQPSVDLLKQVGEWLDRNGEAIYGTKASPFHVDPDWGRVTSKGNMLYLLVKELPESGTVSLTGLRNEVLGARLLSVPDAQIGFERNGDTVSFTLPGELGEEIVSVVAVELDGEADVEKIVIQEFDSAIKLPIHVAEVTGQAKSTARGHTENWKDTDSSASWRFKVHTPGEYEVAAITFGRKRAPQRNGNHDVKVTVCDQTVSGTAGTKDLDMREDAPGPQQVRSALGTIQVEEAGEYTLRVVAERIGEDGNVGLELSGMELAPVAPNR